ncbi:MAG: hypothetical protein EP330_06975 [Deltaproteobacteria bacterium]|nr:MAG: hypothetical protein EP330_06975 [Deltaproteobacteria bacterium]
MTRMLAALAALALVGCSATRSLEPLEKGTGAVTASFGGPINANLGAAIPLPITSVGYMHGLDGKTNLYGAFYPTGLIFFGVPGIDVGVSREVLEPQGARPRIMLDGVVYAFAGNAGPGKPPFAGRMWFDAASTFVWPIGEHALFTSVDLFLQPGPGEFNAYLNPHVGGRARLGRVGLQLEYTWWGPWVDTQYMQAEWRGPGGYGGSTVQLGLDIQIGKKGDR